jgi:putative transposase
MAGTVTGYASKLLGTAVVLPDHLHCVWTLPEGVSDFSTRWHGIKWRFSRAVPAGERMSRRRQDKGERGVWQRRFREHVIRDETDLARHVDCLHYTPVKHGHARRAADWPYSSFRRFVATGVYPLDWAAPSDVRRFELG